MELLKSLVTSKKFIAAIVAALVAAGTRFGLHLDPVDVATIVSPLLVYIAGQAVADHGKEAAKVNAVALSAVQPVPGATAAVSEMAEEVKKS